MARQRRTYKGYKGRRVIVEWNQDEMVATQQLRLARAMDGITKDLATLITRDVSKGQKVKRTEKGNMYGLDPSKKGEPPKVVTGRLRQSWSGEVEVTPNMVRGKVVSSDDPQKVIALEFAPGELGKDRKGLDRPHVRVNLHSAKTKASVRKHMKKAATR